MSRSRWELDDHELIMMLHTLKGKLDASYVKKYNAMVQHLGKDCPYAKKARKAFVKMHKEEILALLEQICESVFIL